MTKVDQNGTTHTYSFDLLGRMTADAVTLASGNPQNVDSSVLRIETSYNTQGLAGTITSFDATSGGNITNQVQNVYNGLGQLTTQYQEHAGAVNTSTSLHVDYSYSDLAHGARLASLTYPNGRVLTYNYGTSSSLDDTLSRLTSISDGNTTLESYAYLGLGTVVERDHPESGANLTYIKQSGESDGDAGDQYTGLDRFTRVVDQRWIDGSGTALDRYGYSYDRNSNRLTKSNSLNGNLSEAYSYDDLNRLANMTRGGSAYQSWDLDGLGNMNSVTTGNVTETRTHNDQNQLLTMGNATLAFDNNGNTVTDDQGHTLVYDAWNRLMVVKSGTTLLKSYSYDGQGWRISEAPTGGTATDLYYSSQWQVLEERQNGNATAQNVWGITYVDQLVLRDRDADQDASHTLEERLYVLQDANENVTAIITTSGTVAERYVLDPYGVVSIRNADWSVRGDGTVSASTFGWVYLHQGGRYDVVAGEYSFRNRDYSPTMMRWMQQDPMRYVDAMSLYLALKDSPYRWTDARGETCCGPDISKDIRILRTRIVQAFLFQRNAKQQRVLRGAINSGNGWDISPLEMQQAWAKKCGYGTGECKGTVTIDHHCYRQEEVNYYLFGLGRRLSSLTRRNVPANAVIDPGNLQQRSDWGTMYDVLISHDIDSDIANMKETIAIYRAFARPFSLDFGAWTSPITTRGRQVWAEIGYTNNMRSPLLKDVEVRGCAACDSRIENAMRLHANWGLGGSEQIDVNTR